MEKKYTAAVITVSDKGSKGEREDVSGQVLQNVLAENGYDVIEKAIVPDEKEIISASLLSACEKGINLVVTTGGTGFSKRDVTPEATAAVVERRADGIVNAMLYNALQKTDRAMLTRGIAGIRGETLIVNLPGSPKAVKEDLEFALPALAHGLDILTGNASECAAPTGAKKD